ncbi:MAG: hypothetical protein ACOZIN_20260 [Myxococcota bacterium]
MAGTDKPERDPRFKPYRVAMYAVYLAFVGTFSSLVIVSVVRSVRAMTPGRQPSIEEVLTVPECLDRAQELWEELDARRAALTQDAPASQADEAWATFRVKWLTNQRQAEADCAVGWRDRAQLRQVFRRLDQAMDLYTTHAVQYAGEVGPTVDAFRAALKVARDPSQR